MARNVCSLPATPDPRLTRRAGGAGAPRGAERAAAGSGAWAVSMQNSQRTKPAYQLHGGSGGSNGIDGQSAVGPAGADRQRSALARALARRAAVRARIRPGDADAQPARPTALAAQGITERTGLRRPRRLALSIRSSSTSWPATLSTSRPASITTGGFSRSSRSAPASVDRGLAPDVGDRRPGQEWVGLAARHHRHRRGLGRTTADGVYGTRALQRAAGTF